MSMGVRYDYMLELSRAIERELAACRAHAEAMAELLGRCGMNGDPDVLKRPRAGGQDQYAGMPPISRLADHLVAAYQKEFPKP